MPQLKRKDFLRAAGLATLPAILPAGKLFANENKDDAAQKIVKFYGDGEQFTVPEYLEALQNYHRKQPIIEDVYNSGGVIDALEKRFIEITGKEKVIFMPTGTMANQLAISVLSGDNTKIFVQDTSHIYRDEADAAQSVHQKRLMPLARNETFFTAAQLSEAIDNLGREEVFKSGVGSVAIENPVRRTMGRMVPLEEIKKISEYCRKNNLKLHLDGARIFLASAWSGVSIKEYASYFDTIYISLYKYLGANAGAILCGDKSVIDKMPHLIKIHGGTMYSNWPNVAMVLNRLEGIDQRLAAARTRADELFNRINKMNGIRIEPLEGGTNLYGVKLNNVDGKKLREGLLNQFQIRIPGFNNKGESFFAVNETILYRDVAYLENAFKKNM